MNELNLKEVDRLELTILVDNYTDVLLLQNTEVIQRPLVPPSSMPILAEHGFSCLLKTYADSQKYTVLMDFGISATCLMRNAKTLGVDFNEVEDTVLSHGHFDHFGGLLEFASEANREFGM